MKNLTKHLISAALGSALLMGLLFLHLLRRQKSRVKISTREKPLL
ncbi:hypothetical protein MRBBS_1293 [Marinobacter sp. BSs20148]|jgi:hypothetical protein|nr:hypothetical protein MRBBS_1293 [Marinobacter sp. BSs20148]